MVLGLVGIEGTLVPFLPSPYRVIQFLPSSLDAIACEQCRRCRVGHDGSYAPPLTGFRIRGDAMSDSALARRALVEDLAIVGLVLESYKAGMARSPNEREAFETAVNVYLAQSADLPEKEARRAVADIICGKQRSG